MRWKYYNCVVTNISKNGPTIANNYDKYLSYRREIALQVCGLIMAKSERLELGDTILRTDRPSYLQPRWHWPAKQSKSVNKRKITAVTAFKVIWHLYWTKKEGRMLYSVHSRILNTEFCSSSEIHQWTESLANSWPWARWALWVSFLSFGLRRSSSSSSTTFYFLPASSLLCFCLHINEQI